MIAIARWTDFVVAGTRVGPGARTERVLSDELMGLNKSVCPDMSLHLLHPAESQRDQPRRTVYPRPFHAARLFRQASREHPGRPTDAVRRPVWAVVPDNRRASVPGLRSQADDMRRSGKACRTQGGRLGSADHNHPASGQVIEQSWSAVVDEDRHCSFATTV
jgi:hypothetical protein